MIVEIFCYVCYIAACNGGDDLAADDCGCGVVQACQPLLSVLIQLEALS